MRLAVEVGTVGDGTVRGAICFCRDLGVSRLTLPFTSVPGYQERGRLDPTACRQVKAEVEDAGLSFSVMVFSAAAPMVMGLPEGEILFANLCRDLEAMQEIGADVLSLFATITPPSGPAGAGARWGTLLRFYRRLIAHAEQTGTRVALHPVAMPARNMLWNLAAVERLFIDIPSANNGLTFCVGNLWNSDGERIYDALRRLKDRLFYVHTRSTKAATGEAPFWFDEGEPDFARLIHILREIDYSGDLRSEHTPRVVGENRTDIGTAWSLGYLRALIQHG